MPRVDQILADMQFGDAVTDHALALRAELHAMGCESEIYAENIHPKLQGSVRSIAEFSGGDCVINHFAIGSDVNKIVRSLNGIKKVLIYHNITPPHYFEGYNLKSQELCAQARIQLAQCAGVYDMCLAVSEYNRLELESLRFQNTHVLPILYDFSRIEGEADRKILQAYGEGDNILFLGRIAPNKKQQDVIKAFYYYKTTINPAARLFLVGSYLGMEKYLSELIHLTQLLSVKDVYFTGQVSYSEMTAFYQVSSMFLSMSEHEGFCVPLLESMHFHLPVLAYASSAVPETLGKGGVLFSEKNYPLIAEMMNKLVGEDEFRSKIIKAQDERLTDFDREKVGNQFREWIGELLG